MPGIAAGARTDSAKFYWHLGDFRANYDFDQDLLAAPEYRDKHLAIADYQRIEWQDFISQQVDPFADIPVYLAIGNHELVPPKTRADYLEQFADWLDAPTIRAQRLRDDPHDHNLRTYYHWIQAGVDFVSLDNASTDQFDDAQVSWIERTLARDETDGNVHTIVVGMHDALPDSISTGHGMNESAQMERSGRRIYQDLLAFRTKTNKYVYVLASHSHFLIESATVCPQVSPEQSRRERTFTDISLGQYNRVAKFILRSRKCSLGIFLHRLESTMEASRCKHVSRRTSPRMLRQVPIVQQAFQAAIDDPRFNFERYAYASHARRKAPS